MSSFYLVDDGVENLNGDIAKNCVVCVGRYVALNGKRLAVVNNTTLPDLPPKEETASKTLSLPPMSFGFVVFKDSNAMACEKNSVS